MSRRTSLMVAHDILIEATMGSNKTNLVYKCNLNFRIIKKWLARLMSKGLIEFTPIPTNTWTTTLKGARFLTAMEITMSIWDNGKIDMNEMKMEVVADG